MKKLALASAIAMISVSAHAQSIGDITVMGISIMVPCASTWSGGADGMVVNGNDLSGTICLDPTGTGQPYVMLGVSMGGLGSTGAIQIATDWNTGPGWGSYSVINVPTTTGIGCTSSVSTPKMTCTATLFGMPAVLTTNP